MLNEDTINAVVLLVALCAAIWSGWRIRGEVEWRAHIEAHECVWEPIAHHSASLPFSLGQTAFLMKCADSCGAFEVQVVDGVWTLDDVLGLSVAELADELAKAQVEAEELRKGSCSCDGDPIECDHQAARGQAEEEARRLRAAVQRLQAEMDERVAAGVQAHVDAQTAQEWER
ncbi:hypothetical protein AB0C10_16015 [Microbispora amethystogenes]|uniref:hypothetical protein n=1 Tax=Microbispora amethystogenes TaxID=1427754 RepID=UPI0033CB7C53